MNSTYAQKQTTISLGALNHSSTILQRPLFIDGRNSLIHGFRRESGQTILSGEGWGCSANVSGTAPSVVMQTFSMPFVGKPSPPTLDIKLPVCQGKFDCLLRSVNKRL